MNLQIKIYRNVEFVAVERPIEGEPKGIPWTLATPYKAGADGWCHMDVHNGDIVGWPTNLGWMMGRPKKRALCVFFRNNHFNAMFKFKGVLGRRGMVMP
ncbi:AMP-binding, conserved site-containing protein [Artemisia annua]|uniref:AMP-binding, conserved site-containing protein n=1 Tax=Artemisia annua TaxID=35608 RepID=A0A2U1QNU2_ARTAN|nr:AMP-binding, conserved site-containing protein [Artemisia annua]